LRSAFVLPPPVTRRRRHRSLDRRRFWYKMGRKSAIEVNHILFPL
jgi:hypothetical protein